MINSNVAMVSIWSYGLVGVLAAVIALYLTSGWRVSDRNRAMCLAVGVTALWGMVALGFAFTGYLYFLASTLLVDVLRFGGWYLFLLLLLRPDEATAENSSRRPLWLGKIAILLVSVAFVSQLLTVLGVDFFVPPARMALFASLAMKIGRAHV